MGACHCDENAGNGLGGGNNVDGGIPEKGDRRNATACDREPIAVAGGGRDYRDAILMRYPLESHQLHQQRHLRNPLLHTSAMQHLTRSEIEAGLDRVRRSPVAHGTLELIVQRPDFDTRVVIDEGQLNVEEGLVGDSWINRPSNRSADGGPHPDMQLAIMNSRFLALLAGSGDGMAQAGDQLIVDLDLSDANLPPGSRLGIGDAVIEITDQPHTGCAKFRARYGIDAVRVVNSELGTMLRLRGVFARVVEPGVIRRGDSIRRLAADLRSSS